MCVLLCLYSCEFVVFVVFVSDVVFFDVFFFFFKQKTAYEMRISDWSSDVCSSDLLYLWWPRGRGLAGVVWPRLKSGRQVVWRDLHAVTGFWVSGLALVLLITALPWAGVWGSAFKAARAEMGWVQGTQDWTLGGEAPSSDGDSNARHAPVAMMQPRPKQTGREHV